MYTQDDVQGYGYIAGLIDIAAAHKFGTTIISPTLFEQASAHPLSGFARILALARGKGLLTDELSQQISDVVDTISAPDNYSDDPFCPVPLQGVWQLAYYRAMGGRPLKCSPEAKGIQAMRKAAGMTQEQLADKLGCSQEHVSRWETGAVTPSAETLKQIAEILGCSIDQLI